ncbi:MAG: hypothetical protein M1114_04525 [Candidatus Dependentiae bacterium]|nr:hypothetical protein [Candidatus Dependentiae bacterium]
MNKFLLLLAIGISSSANSSSVNSCDYTKLSPLAYGLLGEFDKKQSEKDICTKDLSTLVEMNEKRKAAKIQRKQQLEVEKKQQQQLQEEKRKNHDESLKKLKAAAKGYFFGIGTFKKRLDAMDNLSQKEIEEIYEAARSYDILSQYEYEQLSICQLMLGLCCCVPSFFEFPVFVAAHITHDSPVAKTSRYLMAAIWSPVILLEIAKQAQSKNTRRWDNICRLINEKFRDI